MDFVHFISTDLAAKVACGSPFSNEEIGEFNLIIMRLAFLLRWSLFSS